MLSFRHLVGAVAVSGAAACAASAPPIPPPNPAAAACPGYDWAVIDSAWTAEGSVYHPCDVDARAIAAPGNPAPKYPEKLRAQCVAGQAIIQGS